jgi:hypothetical protein
MYPAALGRVTVWPRGLLALENVALNAAASPKYYAMRGSGDVPSQHTTMFSP